MDKALDTLEKMALQSSVSHGKSSNKKSDVTKPQDNKDKPPLELNALTRVLLGISPPSEPTPIRSIQFFDPSLNDSQKEAIEFALSAPEIACIHGPPGTGKTHTLIEIILQLALKTESNPNPKRLLICGASNLSVDNILERLLALPSDNKRPALTVTRIGHPARVIAKEDVLDATLELKANRSEQAALAKDVKNEIEATMGVLSGKSSKGKKPRGLERKKMWDDVKALRKESQVSSL
jgi:DNA polymerase alpha-associated DNA helicase A